jgi:hypothetical protein
VVALPEAMRRQIEAKLARYCERRAPAEVRQRVRLVCKLQGDAVAIQEERPAIGIPGSWVETRIARARFDPATKRWTLYCAGAGSRWRRYGKLDATSSFDAVLAAIDRAPPGVFWG